MFGIGREKRPAPDQIEVILGPRATLKGHIRCDGSIRLEGTMEGGSIETLGNVLVTESAKIMADIRARTVSVAGALKGNIEAQRVELLAGGRVWGRVRVASFLLDDGAFLQGELEMMGEVPEEPFVIPPPSQPIHLEDGETGARK